MLDCHVIEAFAQGVRGQPLREGTRYAREARVTPFIGTGTSVSTLVRGLTDDFDVALWSEEGRLSWRCTCPSWRDPCKHVVAAALVLRQDLAEGTGAPVLEEAGEALRTADPSDAKQRALAERKLAARREQLRVERGAPGRLQVTSPSGFAYPVTVRGGAEGPHGCTCPDFEANRLHTCKHVERVRAFLGSSRVRLTPAFRKAAQRPRIYLHFGEIVEPRLLGHPTGRGAPAVRDAFDDEGVSRRELMPDPTLLRSWLAGFERFVEPDALAWLEERILRRPELPQRPFRRLLPRTPLEPYDYQVEGAKFLAGSGRALLADEMGLGKTVQAILAATVLRQAKRPVRRVTIVCPASLRAGWHDEIARWLGEEAVFVEGPRARRRRTIEEGAPWLITHYEQLLRDHADHARCAPDLLIVDEAQRVKGVAAKTARALKSVPARYLFALTGTPLENRLEEAYAIAQLIDQRLLPPLWQVDRDHFVRDPDGRSVVAYANLGSLRSRLAPAFLRRTKEEVALELPERIRSLVKVEVAGLAREEHDEKMLTVRRLMNKKRLLPADYDRIQRLLVIARRCCDGQHMLRDAPEQPDGKIPKLRELERTLHDLCLDAGRKVVVFSEWTSMTKRAESLCRRLGIACFHLHGGVPVKRRPALIRAFEQHRGAAVFLSTDAGGVGLNLQAADAVVNLDLPWNPAKLEQRLARVHRIGSKKPVRIVLIVATDCVEDGILRLHDTKRNVLENVWATDGEDRIMAPGGSGAFRAMVDALLEREPLPPTMARSSPGGTAEGNGHETPSPEPSAARAPTPAGLPASPVDLAALGLAVAQVAPSLPADHRQSLATVFRALAEALEA